MSNSNSSKESALYTNINRLLSECKITMAELHRQTQVPISTIKRICNDEKANPTISSLLPIADFFSITINQLIGVDSLPKDYIIGAYFKKRRDWISIPILTWEQAINWSSYCDSMEMGNGHFISTDSQVSQKSYALTVDEDDWAGFLKGSILIIDPELKPNHKDYVVTYKSGQNKASFNQFLVDEGTAYLKPLNPSYQIKVLNQDYKFLGVLAQVRMDVKSYDKVD